MATYDVYYEDLKNIARCGNIVISWNPKNLDIGTSFPGHSVNSAQLDDIVHLMADFFSRKYKRGHAKFEWMEHGKYSHISISLPV